MITTADLRKRLTTVPFIPFRIKMTNGDSFEVANHDVLLVGKTTFVVGVSPKPNDVPEMFVQGSLLHIVSVESANPLAG